MQIEIDGLGRIGRQVLRMTHEQDGIDVTHVDDLTEAETLASLLRFDTTHGRWSRRVQGEGGALHIDGRSIPVSAEEDPARCPWGDRGVDVVLESTGVFRKRREAEKHIEAGARRVLMSAPGTDEARRRFRDRRERRRIRPGPPPRHLHRSRRCVDTMTRMV